MKQSNDRRSETRLLCADLVELIWFDEVGRERRRVANLEDISAGGLSLQMEMSLDEGTRLRLRCGPVELAGTVSHVLFRDRAFFVGVEFDEDSRWSTACFLPRHLLDPRSLRHYSPVIPPPMAASEVKWLN